jgi:serine/threonine-protein kinase
MTGRLPINGNVMTEMAKNVALAEPRSIRELRPEISASVDAAVLRCLRKDPGARYASMEELAAALREGSVRRSATTSRLPAYGAIAALAALGVFGAMWWRSKPVEAQSSMTTENPPAMAPPPPSSAASPEPAPSATETAPRASGSASTAKPRLRIVPALRDGGAKPASPPKEDDDILRKN